VPRLFCHCFTPIELLGPPYLFSFRCSRTSVSPSLCGSISPSRPQFLSGTPSILQPVNPFAVFPSAWGGFVPFYAVLSSCFLLVGAWLSVFLGHLLSVFVFVFFLIFFLFPMCLFSVFHVSALRLPFPVMFFFLLLGSFLLFVFIFFCFLRPPQFCLVPFFGFFQPPPPPFLLPSRLLTLHVPFRFPGHCSSPTRDRSAVLVLLLFFRWLVGSTAWCSSQGRLPPLSLGRLVLQRRVSFLPTLFQKHASSDLFGDVHLSFPFLVAIEVSSPTTLSFGVLSPIASL